MHPTTPLKDRAQGRWRGILPALGIAPDYLTGKHCPCPMCGGKDRFRWDNKGGNGTWICTHCGAGDGVSLVMQKTGLPFREAAVVIEKQIGGTPIEGVRKPQSDEDKRRNLKKLWLSSKPVTPGDPAGKYLHRRCGLSEFPPCLRYAPDVRYGADVPSRHPALIALVMAPSGVATSLHRTYLTHDGRKADVECPRRVMPGTIERGSAVRLAEAADVLGIAEGIETAFSAMALHSMPVWAALNSELMRSWEPPSECRHIVVFADNDPGYAGQAAAYLLAKRLASPNRTVDVKVPPSVGTDWNDVYMAANRRD